MISVDIVTHSIPRYKFASRLVSSQEVESIERGMHIMNIYLNRMVKAGCTIVPTRAGQADSWDIMAEGDCVETIHLVNYFGDCDTPH